MKVAAPPLFIHRDENTILYGNNDEIDKESLLEEEGNFHGLEEAEEEDEEEGGMEMIDEDEEDEEMDLEQEGEEGDKASELDDSDNDNEEGEDGQENETDEVFEGRSEDTDRYSGHSTDINNTIGDTNTAAQSTNDRSPVPSDTHTTKINNKKRRLQERSVMEIEELPASSNQVRIFY